MVWLCIRSKASLELLRFLPFCIFTDLYTFIFITKIYYMNYRDLMWAGCFLLTTGALHAQRISYANTIAIDPKDTPEVIINKAAHVIPTDNQMEALENEFIAFIHFGPNTFTRMEWGNGKEDPRIFDLKTLDTDQWCEAIKAAGMKMVMLTVKHHDGFVLWQSRYTTHGIMSTGFRDGKGDILKDLSASCQKYGLKLGIYLSPADLFQIENPEGLYGNLSPYTLRTIPREVPGRPFKNKKTFQFVVDDYNEYFLNQLFEVLTEYGPVHEVWFDGAHPKRKGGQQYNYKAWKELIHTLAPKAVIFGREDVRWCGNESGSTRETEWNVIPYPENPDTTSHFPDMTAQDLGSREKLYDAKYLHYQQAETNTSIREGWFYRDDTHQKVRSADDVFDIYERAVGGNSTFLLNIPPNRDGRFSDADVRTLKEVGKRIKETYGVNLLQGAKGNKEVLDDSNDTYFCLKDSKPEIVIETPQPITFNRLLLQEAVSERGERVESHILEVWTGSEWKEIARGTNIGYKRILRFAPVTASKLRIRFPESRHTPAISTVSAHYYQARPPRLSAQRNREGMVQIIPVKDGFAWKSHGENATANLSSGYQIYYTTDGTVPNTHSKLYTSPFRMDAGTLQAVSVLNGETGAVYSTQMGYIKKGWKLMKASSEEQQHPATAAFDENPATYWQSLENGKSHSLAIDLGENKTIHGIAYTPQTEHKEGMLEKGSLWISNDGTNWKKVKDFELGNLINDPVTRFIHLEQSATARYVKIEWTAAAAESKVATMAEIDIL